jgi:hypothetical protein
MEEYDVAISKDENWRFSVLRDAYEWKLAEERREVLAVLSDEFMSVADIAAAVAKPAATTKTRPTGCIRTGR